MIVRGLLYSLRVPYSLGIKGLFVNNFKKASKAHITERHSSLNRDFIADF